MGVRGQLDQVGEGDNCPLPDLRMQKKEKESLADQMKDVFLPSLLTVVVGH